MRSRGIFLVQDGKLDVLSEAPYTSEDVFQAALAKFPEVLAGGSTTDEATVPRMVLVSREMGVPSGEGAPPRWSLDHLFIDERGVPVIVEVKRSSDTRIRREVVGQMLDYAANGLAYWPIVDLQQALEETARAKSDGGDTARSAERAEGSISGEDVVRESLGIVDVDRFWATVERNLKEGNVRLVFVADRLPRELVRIIEFLNERMSPTEVLGVEVVQYQGNGHTAYVPELVGRTSRAVGAKTSGQQGRWTEDQLLAAARDRHGEAIEALFVRLFDHVRRRKGRLSFGRGVSPGVSGWYPVAGGDLAVWTANAGVHTEPDGSPTGAPSLYVLPGEIKERVTPDRFDSFVDELQSIAPYAAKLADAAKAGWTSKYPTLPLASIVGSGEDQSRLLSAFDRIAEPVEPPDAPVRSQ